ncbi:DUF4347 domain-containing protein [Rosistilla carotiformis]|nr:cadherin-like domain-containing protein [Rosistilla carotiformis]
MDSMEPVDADGAAFVIENADPLDASNDVVTFDVSTLADVSVDPAVRKEIVFIDAAVDDIDTLLSDLLAGDDADRELEVVMLDGGEDGIDQITAALNRRSGIDAIHILSHGDGSGVQLGETRLDAQALQAYAGQIAGWASALDVDADVLIYGCDLASSVAGQDLLASIAALCDCDVAASEDVTGGSQRGGDWDLEYHVGGIEAKVVVSAAAQAQWQHSLEMGTPGSASIWLSTKDDDNISGFDGHLFLDESNVMEIVDPGVQFGPSTSGSVNIQLNLNAFSDLKATLDALHVVNHSQTLGGSTFAGIDLKAGDLLFSSETSVTLTSLNSVHVNESDVVLFSPTTAGDYSTGTFTIVLDNLPSGPLQALTLIERDTRIGDYTVNAGDFLFVSSLSKKQIKLFQTEDVGEGAHTVGTEAVLLDVTDTNIAIGSSLFGIELIESDTQVGGFDLTAGQILLTTDGDGAVGQNGLATTRNDIFVLDVTKTTMVSGANNGVATAAMFFDGSDMNLDSAAESVDAIAFYRPSFAPTDIAPNGATVNENIDTSGGYAVATMTASDLNAGDTATYSIIGGLDQAKFSIAGGDQLILTAGRLDFESQSTYRVEVRVTDSEGLFYDELLTIGVNDLNEAPMASATPVNPTYVENGPPVGVFAATVIDLIEAGNAVKTLTLSVEGVQNGADEIIYLDGQSITLTDGYATTTLIGGYDLQVSVAGAIAHVVVKKTGGFDVGDAEQLLDGLLYQNRSEDPRGGSRIVSLEYIQDDGGNADGGDDDGVFEIASTITLTPVNDAPMVTSVESANITFRENDPATQLSNTLAITDADNTTIESAVIHFSIGYASDQDRLVFVDSGAIRGDWDAATGTLTLTGSETLANYETALRSIRYENTHDDPTASARTITFHVNDGEVDSNVGTRRLVVSAINDEQTLITNAGDTIVEGSTGNVLGAALLKTTDLDHAPADLVYTIETNVSHGVLTRGGLVLSVGETFTQADIDAGLILYDHDGSETIADRLAFTVDDGVGSSIAANFDWTITPLDAHPISAIADIDATAAMVDEGANVGTQVGITARATDADIGDQVTYRLDDDAAGRFSIDAVSGIVRVAAAIDREVDDPLQTIIVRTTSSDGSFTTETYSIAINDVDEFSVGPITDSDLATNAIYENAANGTWVGVTASAIDADATRSAITYSLNDNAGGRFAIDAVTGVVRVADGSLLNFEAATSHDVVVRATSADGSYQTEVFTIEVRDVNDRPEIIGLEGVTVVASNDGSATQFDRFGTVRLVDADAPTDYSGATLLVQGTGFDAADLLDIDTGGTVSLSAGITNGSVVEVDGIAVATLSSTSTSGQTLTFNGNASGRDVEAILQSFRFRSSSTLLGERTVAFAFDDGDGVADGGVQVSATSTVTVTLVAFDETGVTVSEDGTHRFSISDFDHTHLAHHAQATIEITRLPAAGSLTLAGVPAIVGQRITQAELAAGLLEFMPAADGNGTLYASFDFNVISPPASLQVLAGEPNGFTLDGGYLLPTDELLANAANFGSAGTVPSAVTVVPASAMIDADYLAQGDVLFNGYVPDANWTPEEMAAVDTWVQAGGIFIVNSDSMAYDRVSFHFGLAVVGWGSSTWNVADASHPIIDGPFGKVGSVGSPIQATGAIGYFSSSDLEVGDQVLAIDSVTGEPTIVVRQHGDGWILFTGDEGIFRAGMTGGGAVATTNDILVANIFAWAATQTPVTESHTLDIEVTAVNDDPKNLGTVPETVNAWENQAVDVDLQGLELSDVDAGSNDLTLTLSTRSAGTLWAGSGGGVVAFGSGGDSMTLTGTLHALNAYLDDPGQVQYLGAPENFGVAADAIRIDVTDNGNVGIGGGGTIHLGTFDVDLTAVNDAPQIAVNTGATVLEGATDTAITNAMLSGSDADNDDSGLVYTLTNATGHGTLSLIGRGDLQRNDTFTQADINAGRLRYRHDNSETTTDAFEFTLADDGADGAMPAAGRFAIAVVPVNDHTTSTIFDGDVTIDGVSENAAIGTAVGFTAIASDGDAQDTIHYALDDNDGGRFAIDSITGIVRVAGPIDRESDGVHRSITIRATSSDGSFQTQTLVIAVADANEFGVGPIVDLDTTVDSVLENAVAGTLVGIKVTAVDNDATDNAVLFSLIDDAEGRFTIDETTGEIRVADGAVLDFEVSARHTVRVLATGSDLSTSTQTIEIELTDVIEGVPTTTNTSVLPSDGGSGGGTGGTTSVASEVPVERNDDDDSEQEDLKKLLAPPIVDELDHAEPSFGRRTGIPELQISLLDGEDVDSESRSVFHPNLLPANRISMTIAPPRWDRLGTTESVTFGIYETFDFDVTLLKGALDRFADQYEDPASLHLVSGTASCLFAGASVGIAVWVLNSTALIGFVRAAVPAWARFDPIFIVRDGLVSKDDEDLSVAGIIHQNAQRPQEATE